MCLAAENLIDKYAQGHEQGIRGLADNIDKKDESR